MRKDEVRREVERALKVERALMSQVLRMQKQLKSLESILLVLEKELAEKDYEEIAQRVAGSRWKNLSHGKQKDLVRAIADTVESYLEDRSVSVSTVQVLSNLYRSKYRNKRSTTFSTLLLNLSVRDIIEKDTKTIRDILDDKRKSGKLLVLKSGSPDVRPASMKDRTFDKLFTYSSIRDTRNFLRDVLGPYIPGQKTLADI